MSDKTHVFISHIAEEQTEANRAKEYLDLVFLDNVDVFVASSAMSILPGEDWFDCIAGAIEKADIMLVFCSGDSVGRPWVQFETGAGWFAKKTKVIPVCHKGMTPKALPQPISRLQAVDINADSEGEQLKKLAQAVKAVANLPEPTEISMESLPLTAKPGSTSSLRGWVLRPNSHIGEQVEGVFRVGMVASCDISRGAGAGVDPNDAIYVRLHVEPSTGQYANAIAAGNQASFWESEEVAGTMVLARLRLAASFPGQTPDDRPSPLIVVEDVKPRQG